MAEIHDVREEGMEVKTEREKNLNLMTFWLFSTVVIVFAAVTTFVWVWARPMGATLGQIMMDVLPITLIVAVVAAIIYAIYYFVFYKR